VKALDIIEVLAKVIAIIVLMCGVGWICSETGITGEHPPVTTRFSFGVLVIDENGTLVPDQTVYAITCIQEPAGWTVPTRYVDIVSLSGVTDENGHVWIETGNYTLTRNDILWMGASTSEPLLASDEVNKSFSPGGIGKWARYNYSDIRYNEGMNISSYARLIMVRNSDGRMIDVSQFNRESGQYFPQNRLIDAFAYMDNRSWTYST